MASFFSIPWHIIILSCVVYKDELHLMADEMLLREAKVRPKLLYMPNGVDFSFGFLATQT